MKTKNALFAATAVVFGICASTGAFAKTAKDCIAEWRADKAGMQARGTTEKAYVEQCKGGAEPTAAAPAAPPPQAAPSAPRQATASGSKTAKDCIAEWRADKAGMQARGTTQKAYVEQCRGGAAPAASLPVAPTAAAPAPSASPSQTGAASAQKTAKECVAEPGDVVDISAESHNTISHNVGFGMSVLEGGADLAWGLADFQSLTHSDIRDL